LSEYDAVIVGGGHNGLVAAAYLARAGRSCLLLERLDRLGGAAVSEHLFPGLDARLSSFSYLVSLLPQLIVDELNLPLTLLGRGVSSYTPDPRRAACAGLLVDESNGEATLGSFRRIAGDSDWRAWERFYAMTRRIAEVVFPTLTEPLLSRRQMRERLADDAAWEAIFERPLGQAVSAAFADELVAGVVLTDALIGTFADADDADLRQNRCFLYHVIGRQTGDWLVPRGGMGAVTDALSLAASRAGAELRTRAEVIALEPDGEGASLLYSDGAAEHRVRAGRVLVNAAPAELRRLLGESPAQPGPEGCQLKVNLLLSHLPRPRDRTLAPEKAFAGTFHVNEMAGQLSAAHRQATAGKMPVTVPCEAYCHSLTDPGILGPELRAAGAQTLTVFALHMPARLFEHDPPHAREQALAATIASLQSVLDEPIEDCLLHDADGRPCIQARSPLDLQEHLRMPAGHIFHRDLSWPFAEHEHEAGSWGVETDHPAILLCGAGARRGGGVSGIPGRNAAMAVLATR
jgi:phytoene dehydrogenase-like protein